MERIKYKNSQKLKGIVDKVFVTDGDAVKEGQSLAIISTQGGQYEVIAHADGIIKNVYIIESIVVSHGDIIFDIYTPKEIKRMVLKKDDLTNTLKFSLQKSGYLNAEIQEIEDSDVTDDDFGDFDYTRDDEKEKTMRFNSINDNNKNNFHSDIPTDEQFNLNEPDDLDFSSDSKKETPAVEETIEMNIPTNLENLDDLTIMDDSSLQKRVEKKVETEDFDLTFKSNDITSPTEIFKDNDVDQNELSFETFQLSITTVIAEKRLRDDEKAMEEALRNAISYDSVTQAIDEIEIKEIKSKQNDFNELRSDFDFLEENEEAMERPATVILDEPVKEEVKIETKEDVKSESPVDDFDFSSMDSLGSMSDIKANLIKNEPTFDETKTIDVIKKVDEQIESEKNEPPVDISEEAMNKSFEKKMQSNFLSAFSNAGTSQQVSSGSDGIYENLAENIRDMNDNKNINQPEPQKVSDDAPIIDEEELDRIESLLNIDDFGLDDIEPISVSTTPTKSIIQKEIIKEIVTPSASSEEIEKLITDKTLDLAKELKNQDNEIQELKNRLSEVMEAKPKANGKLTFSNIKTTICEYTFQTNVTALMNLQSILLEPFSAKGIELTFGTFAALGVAKTIAKNNVATEGLSFNWVDGIKFKTIKMACSASSTIAEIAKTVSEVKSNAKLKTSVSLFDMTNSIVTTANISTDDIFTVVIGKVEETENMTGTLTTKIIFDRNRFSLDEALKFVYEFNALIENPGFLI